MTNVRTMVLLIAAAVLLLAVIAAVVLLVVYLLRKGRQDSPEEAGSPRDHHRPRARLMEESGSGQLVVELDGRAYASADTLNPREREKMLGLIASWQQWLGLPVTATTPPQPPAYPKAQSAYTPAPEELLVPPTPSRKTDSPPPAVEPPPPGTAGIVAQVDAVLQELLPGTPYAGRSIHLTERLGLGVDVWIGAQRYDGVDAVPDPEIQALLRRAVRIWEQRSAK